MPTKQTTKTHKHFQQLKIRRVFISKQVLLEKMKKNFRSESHRRCAEGKGRAVAISNGSCLLNQIRLEYNLLFVHFDGMNVKDWSSLFILIPAQVRYSFNAKIKEREMVAIRNSENEQEALTANIFTSVFDFVLRARELFVSQLMLLRVQRKRFQIVLHNLHCKKTGRNHTSVSYKYDTKKSTTLAAFGEDAATIVTRRSPYSPSLVRKVKIMRFSCDWQLE